MFPSHYETSNVYLASFLRSQGVPFLGFERVSKRRVQFHFAADETLHDLVRLYWSGAPVSLTPLALFGALRYLKSVVRRRSVTAISNSTSALPLNSIPPIGHAQH